MITRFLFLFPLFLLFSCDDDFEDCQPEADPLPKCEYRGEPIHFQIDAWNYAWGSVHFTWIIDEAGNIIEFDLSYMSLPNRIDSTGKIAPSLMIENIASADTVFCAHVDTSELQQMIDLLPSIFDHELVSYAPTCVDCTSYRFAAWRYNAEKEVYESRGIFMWGSLRAQNESENSQALVDWFWKITGLIPDFINKSQ